MLNASPTCTSQGNDTPRDEPLPELDCVGQEDENTNRHMISKAERCGTLVWSVYALTLASGL